MDDSTGKTVDKMAGEQPSGTSRSSPKEKEGTGTSISKEIPPPPKVQLGLNEEIVHGGVKLHVQTEDLGIKKFKILTIVFRGGEVLFSKLTEYGDLKKDDTFWEAVMERVKFQHRTVIEDVKNGMLEDKISV